MDLSAGVRVRHDLGGERVLVVGHSGVAGSAIVRRLRSEQCEILLASRGEVDLIRQAEVEEFFAGAKADAVFLAAGKVGGIHANNTRPAEFIYENLQIEANVIHAAWRTGVKKLLFLASSSIFPRLAPQPLAEEALFTGPLEPTNEAYAVAKLAGIELCQAYRQQYGCDFIAAIPTNLYGPWDRYDAENGHVVSSLIMKIHAAKMAGAGRVVLWGSGAPRREFLYTEDMADALVFMMKHYSGRQPLNLGTGREHSIRELAEAIAGVVGWKGEFVYDASKPDGMPRKVMDVSRLAQLGWTSTTPLKQGLKVAYDWYVANLAEAAGSALGCSASETSQ